MHRLPAVGLLVTLILGFTAWTAPSEPLAAAPSPPGSADLEPDQPTGRSIIPRSKPGREHPSARSATNGVPTLDHLIATGVQSDPLSANPTLLKLNQVGIVYPPGIATQMTTAIYTATSASYQPAHVVGDLGLMTGARSGTAAAGDLNGDGADDLIIPVLVPSQGYCLAYVAQSFAASYVVTATSQTSCEVLYYDPPPFLLASEIQLKTGFFFAPPYTVTAPIAQLATAFVRSNFDLCLRLWMPVAPGSLELQWLEHLCPVNLGAALAKKPDTPGFSLAVGDFDGNGQDELALAWVTTQGSVFLATYGATPAGALRQLAITEVRLTDPSGTWPHVPLGGNVSLTTGDFDGDGCDEIALASLGLGQFLVFGNPFKQVWTQMVIYRAAGDALTRVGGWNDPTTTQAGSGYDQCPKKWGPGAVRAAAGRFRFREAPSDQVAIVAPSLDNGACVFNQQYTVDFRIYAVSFDSSLNVDLTATQPLSFHIPFDWHNDTLVIANLSLTSGGIYASIEPPSGLRAQAVSLVQEQLVYLLLSGDAAHPAQSAVVAFAPDWSSVDIDNDTHWFPGGVAEFTRSVAIVAGDFAGRSLRVGPPTVAIDQQMLSEVDGILYAPPTHFDQFPEIGPSATITINVNWNTPNCVAGYDDCTRTNYNTTTISSTQQSTQVQRSWSLGAGPPPDVEAAVQGSLAFRYGQNFQKTTTNFASSTFGTTTRATTDDIVMFRAIEYTIWQYPLYLHNILQGYLLVVWPTAESCDASGCQPIQQAEIASGLETWFYRPNHDPSNVLSYAAVAPSTIVTQLLQPQYLAQVATGQAQGWTINNETTVTTETVKSQNFNLNFNFSFLNEVAALGGKQLGATIDASFAQATIQGSQRRFDQTTSLTGYLEDLSDQLWSYLVGPSAGWTSEGYFEVGYAATPGTIAGASNWILPQYYGTTKPDFTFTLKNRVNQTLYPDQFFTTDVFIDPACPTPGQPITLTARVRNYSIVGWSAPVEVTFFNGDPSVGGAPIATTSIVSITAQGTSLASANWSAPAAGSYDIWAVIDRSGHVPEIHKANNRGWFQLQVAPDDAAALRDDPPSHHRALRFGTVDVCGGTPRPGADLAITSSSLSARGVPTTALAGRTLITLTARVSASGSSFANVPVAFYEGDPRRGGRRIGYHVVPVVHAGKSTTATVVWDATGKTGHQTIHAVIWRSAAAERNHRNNVAFFTIDLPDAPHRAYLVSTPQRFLLNGPAAINVRPGRAIRRRAGRGRRPRSSCLCA